MESSSHLLSSIQLGNGLTIYFYDRSKPIAGDRCQVKLLISVPIMIEPDLFEGCDEPQRAYEMLVAECGSQIVFEVEKVRNFIDAAEKDEVLESLKKDFLQSNLEYLGNPDFSRKYIHRKVEEMNKERYWRRAYEEAISASQTER